MSRSAASHQFSAHAPTVSAEAQRVLSILLNDQRQRWRRGERVLVESYLTSMANLQEDREGLLDLICNEVVLRAEKGDVPQLGEYLRRFEAYHQKFPEFAAQLRFLFEVEGVIQKDSVSTSVTIAPENDFPASRNSFPTGPSAERMVGRYEILGELGRGAMGVVYRARQSGLNRIVALKMILTGDYAAPDDLIRFRSEAEAVARLQHPNIVQIYEVGEHDGLPFFSLEFVSDGSLAKKLAGVPIAARQAAQLTETLACAVHYAHQRGVIHRDLKPGNVLLTENGTPKITDFGLAKRLETEPGSDNPLPQTKSGDIMGTPSYMAPEQALGQTTLIGPVTDVYALGAILYELLTGRPPFRGANTVETLHQVVFDDLVPPGNLQPKLPRDLETICLKCLQKEARKRYATAEELADDLHRFLAGETIRARRTGIGERGLKFARRRPALALIFFSAPLVFAGLLGLSIYARQKAIHAEAAAQAAQIAELHARRQAYRALIHRAWREWNDDEIALAASRLSELIPAGPEQTDLRGFEWYYLNKLCHSDLCTIPGAHTAVAFSPDGQVVAAAGAENSAKIWDTVTGKEIRSFTGHEGPVRSLAFDPSGLLLATGGEDMSVRVWDAKGGNLVWKSKEHKRAVNKVSFRPDGKRIASAGGDGRVILWDTKDGTKVATFNGHNRPVYSVVYSPDGRLLASSSGSGDVLIWDESRKIVAQPPNGDDPVTALGFTTDSQRLLAGGLKGSLTLWAFPEGKDPEARELHMGGGAIKGIALSRDGRFFATASLDRTVRVFSSEDGSVQRSYRGHSEGVTDVAFSPDGARIASAGGDPAIKFWDTAVDPVMTVLAGQDPHNAVVRSIAFSPDSRNVASAGFDRRVKIWDSQTGKQLRSFEAAHGDLINSIAYSPDGKFLATGSADRSIKIWPLEGADAPAVLRGHTGAVESLAYSPDGREIVSASRDGTVRIWDIGRRELTRTLTGHGGEVTSVAFSVDGQRIASGGDDHTVRIWMAKTGQPILVLAEHTNTVDTVAFSPDGRYLASGSHDHTVKVWDASTGSLIRTLLGHIGSVQGTVFGPNSEHLISVSASPDRKIRFWDVFGDQETLTLDIDPNWLSTYCIAISPDGKRLAWGGGERRRGEVRLLDARAGWDASAAGN
jgi:WD40 repeat protein/cell division protein FtsB